MMNTYEKELQESVRDSVAELSENELNDVSGGFGLGGALLFVGGCYVAGRIYGYYAGKKTGICG